MFAFVALDGCCIAMHYFLSSVQRRFIDFGVDIDQFRYQKLTTDFGN